MKLLPFDSFTMRTDLSPEQVKAALDDSIVHYSFKMSSDYLGRFGGYTLGEASFYLELIGYRNLAQLEIKADVTAAGQGSLISAKVRLASVILFVKGAIILFLCLIAMIMSSDMISSHHISKQGVVSYFLLVGIFALWMWEFNSNVAIAKKNLAEIINAKTELT